MNRIFRRARHLALAAALPLSLAGETAAQDCDPNAGWRVFEPTGDVAEILTVGQIGWIAAKGGVIRIDLAGVAGGAPTQLKITDTSGLVSTDLTCMARDGFGNIWVGTRELGVSVFDAAGGHVANLNSFDYLWSDKIIALGALGDRVVIVSANAFLPNGSPEGGGFAMIQIKPVEGGGYEFIRSLGTDLEVGHETLVEDQGIWFGTSGDGLWQRDESVVPAVLRQVLTSGTGLPSNNVKKLVRAPAFGSSTDQLWIGTGAGLVTFDTVTEAIGNVTAFGTENILDLWRDGNSMYVLSESGSQRDLYSVDLGVSPARLRVPRSDCFPDTVYVPREVAVDSAGRIVLGTQQVSFSVRQALESFCPPSLGPHAALTADLVMTRGGTLYFGTGDKLGASGAADGIGVFTGANWTSITRADGIVHRNMVEVLEWGDGTIWFASRVDLAQGGVNRYFPGTGALETYHPSVQNVSRRTLGRNCYSLEADAQGNLWIVYGQIDGGLSVIDAQTHEITNYPISSMFSGQTELVRDVAFDSRGYLWIVSRLQRATLAPRLYVIDTGGTIHDRSDDRLASYIMSTEIVNVGDDVWNIEIDSRDRILIAGEDGLAYGVIHGSTFMSADWEEIAPNSSQGAGHGGAPYRVVELDWDDNFWVGTEESGAVRLTPAPDPKDWQWSWYDEIQGCPLPDQSVAGLHADFDAKVMWVGTAAGIARIDLSATAQGGDGDKLDPQPFPNPWNPEQDGPLGFADLPVDRPVTLRIWTSAGELVFERQESRGTQTWTGENSGGKLVESGVYLITASSTDDDERTVWEGKVAVVR